MQAIILAAGMGKRLRELTEDNTKCMVEVNGITLIERMLRGLDKKNLTQIIIVIGYKGQKLMDFIKNFDIRTPIHFINNPIYNKTNNIYSLSLAKDYLITEDTLLLESDLIFEESILDDIINDARDTLALVDKFQSWMDGTCMKLAEDDSIAEFIPGKFLEFSEKENYFKTVNIYKFSKHFSMNTYVPFLEAYKKSMGLNEYYESVIKLIALLETKELKAKRLDGKIWYEIDDIQDLDIAESLFADSKEKRYSAICSRFGGYWRYPYLIDFCYLVNPYYPPRKMIEEIKSNFQSLLTQYPSGMRVNNLLAAKNFAVKSDYLLLGNGAAELIKILMEKLNGRMGFIKPTFEEYPNRKDISNSIVFKSKKDDFSYSFLDLIQFFENPNHSVQNIILINPDNPSGNYIKKCELLKFAQWCSDSNINLVVDESFADFADAESVSTPEGISLIDNDILKTYKNLYVIKSISKSYGVPGIRLGILASGNSDMIIRLKKDLPIWNINSFGEFYMQIAEKYKKDYYESLDKLKKARSIFIHELSEINYIKVFPSQANYIMCEILNGKNSKELASTLLDHGILIKDLSDKIGNGKQYIRLAVRNIDENQMLIKKLQVL